MFLLDHQSVSFVVAEINICLQLILTEILAERVDDTSKFQYEPVEPLPRLRDTICSITLRVFKVTSGIRSVHYNLQLSRMD